MVDLEDDAADMVTTMEIKNTTRSSFRLCNGVGEDQGRMMILGRLYCSMVVDE